MFYIFTEYLKINKNFSNFLKVFSNFLKVFTNFLKILLKFTNKFWKIVVQILYKFSQSFFSYFFVECSPLPRTEILATPLQYTAQKIVYLHLQDKSRCIPSFLLHAFKLVRTCSVSLSKFRIVRDDLISIIAIFPNY